MAQATSRPVFPLPHGLNGGVNDLSRDARSEIKSLSGPRPGAFLLSAAMSWVSILALIFAAEQIQHIAFTIVALILIAGRQMALGYLVHDQAHHLGFRSRYGDLYTNLIAGYPLLLITVEGYAQVHLTHHRHYFKDNDPDFNRKSGDEWAQPMPAAQLIRLFLKDLSGLNVIKLIRGKKMTDTPYPRRWKIPAWVRPAYLLLFAVIFTVGGFWDEFLLYWLLPLVTFFQVISRLGALCEHRYNLPQASLEDSTPMIILPWWQKLLVPDLNFHYHIYHHYFPGVSFSNLPRVHSVFEREGLVNSDNIYHGYHDYFRRTIIQSTAPSRSSTSS